MTQEMLENDAIFFARFARGRKCHSLMILPLEIKQFESIDTQNFLAREARRNFVTSLGPKAPKNLPNLVKSHENFV